MSGKNSEVVSTGLLSAHKFSLVIQLPITMNCEHLLPIYHSLFKKRKMFFTCIKKLGKLVFSKQKYLLCLTFSRHHLPINLDLSEVNSSHFILGLFYVVRSTSSLPFIPMK